MESINEIKEKLKRSLSRERFDHSVRVAEQSVILARRFGADVLKAETAGILHDCARNLSFKEALNEANNFGIILDNITKNSPGIIHAVVGEMFAKSKYNIKDREVLKAIRYHTTGRGHMSLLEKIIFLADYTEPCRDFPGVEITREILGQSLDGAILHAMGNIITYLIEKKRLIHLDTIEARNYILTRIP